jgi:hypothetical protein
VEVVFDAFEGLNINWGIMQLLHHLRKPQQRVLRSVNRLETTKMSVRKWKGWCARTIMAKLFCSMDWSILPGLRSPGVMDRLEVTEAFGVRPDMEVLRCAESSGVDVAASKVRCRFMIVRLMLSNSRTSTS